MKAKVNEELKRSFRPEFLNRVDETIVFPQLTQVELLQIVELFIKRLSVRLEERDLTLELTDAAKKRLMEIGWEPSLGARPLRRAVQREIEDKISEQILQGELKNSSHIKVDFVDGEFVFASNVRESVAITA
jgi:ATP-dependent Clp protease ATP-binding subunit ClpC